MDKESELMRLEAKSFLKEEKMVESCLEKFPLLRIRDLIGQLHCRANSEAPLCRTSLVELLLNPFGGLCLGLGGCGLLA